MQRLSAGYRHPQSFLAIFLFMGMREELLISGNTSCVGAVVVVGSCLRRKQKKMAHLFLESGQNTPGLFSGDVLGQLLC